MTEKTEITIEDQITYLEGYQEFLSSQEKMLSIHVKMLKSGKEIMNNIPIMMLLNQSNDNKDKNITIEDQIKFIENYINMISSQKEMIKLQLKMLHSGKEFNKLLEINPLYQAMKRMSPF